MFFFFTLCKSISAALSALTSDIKFSGNRPILRIFSLRRKSRKKSSRGLRRNANSSQTLWTSSSPWNPPVRSSRCSSLMFYRVPVLILIMHCLIVFFFQGCRKWIIRRPNRLHPNSPNWETKIRNWTPKIFYWSCKTALTGNPTTNEKVLQRVSVLF